MYGISNNPDSSSQILFHKVAISYITYYYYYKNTLDLFVFIY